MKKSVLILSLFCGLVMASSLEDDARAKMIELETLINKLDSSNIDSQRERLALRTSEVFLEFATWDEANIDKNRQYFYDYPYYRDQADKLANDLPDFERGDVIKLLDETLTYGKLLLDGEVFREPTPVIDWAQVHHEEDQLTYNGRPVFLADYTWKPEITKLTEFYGDKDGYYISPMHIASNTGSIQSNIKNEVATKSDGRPWFIFINNSAVPSWATEKYGEDFTAYKGEPFFNYDVDHPGAKEMIGYLLDGFTADMSGKKYSELGYMLCNEPRWITYKDGGKKVWYTSGVSSYTMAKFRTWLDTHYSGDIAKLNKNWKTSFASFSAVQLEIPIDISNQGNAKWYDWNMFNDYRATEWFTWMKARLRENDPLAKAHFKIMPSFFTDNDPATGIDLEVLTEMSEINGNDVAAHYNHTTGGVASWEKDYVLGWRELHMGYDFIKSVKPNNLNFNTESHILSTGHTRDLYMNPKYVRATYWAATMLGMDVSQTWYWPREADGSIKRNLSNAYAGSNNQQPRVTNELHHTMMDLNSFSEEIMKYQRERKPVRIFYSRTSAHNRHSYMDDVYKIYESLNFEGISLGFATEKIIKNQDHSQWDMILINGTDRVTRSERDALQSYLDAGGTIIMENNCLKFDEYGGSMAPLIASKGTLLRLTGSEYFSHHTFRLLGEKGNLPKITLVEENDDDNKGCYWRAIENERGNQVLTVINYGKTDAEISIELKGATNGTFCKDLLKGIAASNKQTLAPYEMIFFEVGDESLTSNPEIEANVEMKLYPSVTDGYFNIDLAKTYSEVDMKIYNVLGQTMQEEHYDNTEFIQGNVSNLFAGQYLIFLILNGNEKKVFKLTKK